MSAMDRIGTISTAGSVEGTEHTDDEAFARALQEEEERNMMSRLIAAQMGMAGPSQEKAPTLLILCTCTRLRVLIRVNDARTSCHTP